MPDFTDLVADLAQRGVEIHGVEKLTKAISMSDSWTAVFVEMAMTGKRIGVELTRQGAYPTDAELDHILGGYPFDQIQRQLVVQNVVVTG